MTDASMNPGARRLAQILSCTIACAANGVALAAEEGTASRFVDYYQTAYAEGRDNLLPITPEGALSGSAFLACDRAIIQLAGVQGCLSTAELEFTGGRTTCFMVSLAGITAILEEAEAAAGNALRSHFLGRSDGAPTIHFAECFFTKDGETQSLSQLLISAGVAFAARDGSGRALFPEYAAAETRAQNAKAGIWANAHFRHPYGERYRANPSTN